MDGTFARHLEDFLFRAEQIELLDGLEGEMAHVEASFGDSLTAARLRPTLLRALRLLRWSQVRYWLLM